MFYRESFTPWGLCNVLLLAASKKAMDNNPAKILVIEDNPADVFLLRFALNYHKEEYELELLRDGDEAIRFVNEQRTLSADPQPCVIVLDLNLPKEDGKAVLKAIKQEPVLAHIQVIALSSFASPRDAAEVQRLGARLYRAKPMQLDDWIALAGEILAICREPVAVPA
jgi:chemotaxis family two-component system response regulator Rcp1